MQTYPYSCWSCASICEGGNLIFNKTTCLWTVMQRPFFASHFHALKNDHMTGASMQFSLWRDMIDGTNCHISRIAMHTIPYLTQFKVAQLRIYEILNRARKIWHNNIFETRTEFFLVERERQREDWRKNTGRRLHRRQCSHVKGKPGSSVLEFGFKMDCLAFGTYTGCFTTLGHNCRRWFPRSLWWKKFI